MKKFIALLALTASLSAMATDYKCVGTEPFWSLKITETQMSLDMEDVVRTESVQSKIQAAGMADEFAFVVTSASGSATVISGECSDGMSDNIYSHHVVVKAGPMVLAGCCNQGK